MFDVTDVESFQNVCVWLKDIERFGCNSVHILLVGNKCDLAYERKVTFEEAKAFADRNHIDYIETSAKLDKNVDRAFLLLARKIKKGTPTALPDKRYMITPPQIPNVQFESNACC